jgi:type III restriction enzyme
MVRTPLARRVESDESLNSVALYLPKYDRGALQRIVAKLKAGDPDTLPALDVEEGEGQVNCDRIDARYGDFKDVLAKLATYVVPIERRLAPVPRLESLAGALSDLGLKEDAPDIVDERMVQKLVERLEVRRKARDFEATIKKSREVGLNALNLSYLTGETIAESVRVESTSRSLERLFDQVGRKAGAALHQKLWRRIRKDDPSVDGETARLYVIATLGEAATLRCLADDATQMFDDWLAEFADEIEDLSSEERMEIDDLLEHADVPTKTQIVLRDSIRARRDSRSVDWPQHIYADGADNYPDTFNKWEGDSLETELAGSLLCWLRNRPRGRGSLCIPYEKTDGRVAGMYPDFLMFHKDESGSVVVDLVDPHGLHLDDAPAKARALAEYAKKHGSAYRRILMVIYDKDVDVRVTLDLRKSAIRNQVAKVTTVAHLQALFELVGGE